MSFSNPHCISSCSITCEDFKDGDAVIRLPCDHFFEPDSITAWLERDKTCPLCRIDVSNSVLVQDIYQEPPKFVICSTCNKSKYRNKYKGLDINFKCSNCRKKNTVANAANTASNAANAANLMTNIMTEMDHNMKVVMVYSLFDN